MLTIGVATGVGSLWPGGVEIITAIGLPFHAATLWRTLVHSDKELFTEIRKLLSALFFNRRGIPEYRKVGARVGFTAKAGMDQAARKKDKRKTRGTERVEADESGGPAILDHNRTEAVDHTLAACTTSALRKSKLSKGTMAHVFDPASLMDAPNKYAVTSSTTKNRSWISLVLRM